MRASQRGRRSVGAGGIVAALVGAVVGLGATGASAADRLKHSPIGTMSLATSLDDLGLIAPQISMAVIARKGGASDQWYSRLAFIQQQSVIAAVFESRFNGFSVAKAAAPSMKLAALAKQDRVRASSGPVQPAGAAPAVQQPAAPVELAYADPSPTAVVSDAFSALSVPTQDGTGPADVQAELPLSVPLPDFRPAGKIVEEQEPDEQEPEIKQSDRAKKDKQDEEDKQEKLALAKPDLPVEKEPSGKKGFSLRDLFGGGARAGNGVAVYDISAAKVYMPDGSVLEAHSGVGQMADNPHYVHVKMNGPTPPHTYNLKIRERRFHGVEAIRMLPVDGRNKYGRDGFLTHSYLLRGRAGQSHGCVAFKDYSKFLKAFKEGKVKQLVVVSGGGKAVASRVAKTDRST